MGFNPVEYVPLSDRNEPSLRGVQASLQNLQGLLRPRLRGVAFTYVHVLRRPDNLNGVDG